MFRDCRLKIQTNFLFQIILVLMFHRQNDQQNLSVPIDPSRCDYYVRTPDLIDRNYSISRTSETRLSHMPNNIMYILPTSRKQNMYLETMVPFSIVPQSYFQLVVKFSSMRLPIRGNLIRVVNQILSYPSS